MGAGRTVSTLLKSDHELPKMVRHDLADLCYLMLPAELDKNLEFLVVELDRSPGQIAGAAGMQVDLNPLLEIIGLVDFQSEVWVGRKKCFHLGDTSFLL